MGCCPLFGSVQYKGNLLKAVPRSKLFSEGYILCQLYLFDLKLASQSVIGHTLHQQTCLSGWCA